MWAQAIVARRQITLVARPRDAAVGVQRVDLRIDLRFHALACDVQLALLVDRRVHVERQDHRRRAVDRHRHRRPRVGQVEARVELLGVVDRRDTDP